jgi:hypothetical protein
MSAPTTAPSSSPTSHPTPPSSTPTTSAPTTAPTSSPPAPTSTPPPSTSSPNAPGEARNATNTGLAGDAVAASDLTPVSGAVTYGTSYSGQTISLKSYTGTVTLTGSHITIKDCKLTNGGLDSVGFLLRGDHNTVQNCNITAPAGQSMYEPVWVFGDSNQVLRNNISRGENLLTTYGTNVTIAENYMHDVALDSNPGDHPDGIEVYGGGPTLIRNNRIEEDNQYDAPVNVAPYNGYTVTDLTVQGNFLDNGQSIILLDNQNPNGFIHNTRVTGNAFGGHQCVDPTYCFGRYHPSLNYDGRHYVQTESALTADPNAVLWPTTGADVNKWEENNDLTPNKNGQVVIPS